MKHPLILALGLVSCNNEPPPPRLDHGWTISPTEQVRQAGIQARASSDPSVFETADAALAQLISQQPCNVQALIAQGQLTVDRWRYEAERGQADSKPSPTALQSFEVALACEPNNQGALQGMGWYYEQIGEHDKALDAYRKIAASQPDDHGIQLNLGTALMQNGHFHESITVLEGVADRHRERDEPEAMMVILDKLGRAYIRVGEYEHAEALLQESVEIMESLRQDEGRQEFAACPYVALGQLYRSEGRDEQGAEMFLEAARVEADKPGAQHRAAQYLFWTGDLQQARVYADRAITLDNNPDYAKLLAQIDQAIAAGEQTDATVPAEAVFDAAVRAFDRYAFDEAQAFAERAASAEQNSSHEVMLAMVALMQADYPKAEAAIDRAAHYGRDPAAVAIAQAHLAIARKDYAGAQRLLSSHLGFVSQYEREGALEMDPAGWSWLLYKLAHLGMGWVHANQGRHSTAAEYFDKVLRLQPSDRFALIGRANAHNAQGELAQAEAMLLRVLEIEPENMYAIAELGLVALNRGDTTAAQERFEHAKDLAPTTYTCPHEGLGMVYLRKGETEKAKTHFEQAIAINPDIEYKKFNGLARIYMDEGRYDEAEGLLRRSMENYPHDSEAKELLAELEAMRPMTGPEPGE